jgi:hypothetical protein
MKQNIPAPVVIGILVCALVVALGFGWSKINDNGERPNPNVGHPTKGASRGLSMAEARNETKEQYYKILKDNRPDLSEAELQAKTDNWWRIKSGGQ